MKKLFATAAILAAAFASILSCTEVNPYGLRIDRNGNVIMPEGKEVYIQQEWKDSLKLDLQDPESDWSYHRMYCTKDISIFWQKGFGADPSVAPDLDGHPMTFDVFRVADRIQYFYDYFYEHMGFILPGSKAEKYRMLCFVKYDLEATAYGGNVDDTIGALWVTPVRIQDEAMNCIAHELGHAFQFQIMCDGTGDGWGGSGFYEMTSQWMLWTVNNDWMTSEKYHWDDFNKLTHKAYLDGANIYHSPYVLMWWSQQHGEPIIADLYREGKRGDDPVITYKEHFNMNQEQFNDDMYEGVRTFINWDWKNENIYNEARPYANKNVTALVDAGDGWQRVSPDNCPENYGYNGIALPLPKQGETVSVSFRGEAGIKGYSNSHVDNAGWRYGFVAVDKDGKASYGETHSEKEATISYTAETELSYLWLVVMGAPTEHVQLPGWRSRGPNDQWPYSIRIN